MDARSLYGRFAIFCISIYRKNIQFVRIVFIFYIYIYSIVQQFIQFPIYRVFAQFKKERIFLYIEYIELYEYFVFSLWQNWYKTHILLREYPIENACFRAAIGLLVLGYMKRAGCPPETTPAVLFAVFYCLFCVSLWDICHYFLPFSI